MRINNAHPKCGYWIITSVTCHDKALPEEQTNAHGLIQLGEVTCMKKMVVMGRIELPT
jgi:hypothetical protein